MKILHDDTLNTQRLPPNHRWLSNHHLPLSKVNIKLKTHSLTSLDIPLQTSAGVNGIPSSFGNHRQRTMAGSMDSVSEMPPPSTNENLSGLSPTEPLLTIVSSRKQQSSISSEYRPLVKHRFRMSTSFLTPNSFNDSVARLRRTGYCQQVRQPSVQTIDKLTERKPRPPAIRNGSIPKFSFRDLPAVSRLSTSNNPLKETSQSQISSFTSLPEIRSFVAQHCSDHQQTINDQFRLPISSSWKKTDSWSWKSTDRIEKTAIIHEPIQSSHVQVNPSRFDLPVIIESPLPTRSSLQTIKQENHLSSKTSTNNQSVRHDCLPLHSNQFSPSKKSIPHSLSNYEVCSNRFSVQSAIHYPSTPHLASSRRKYLDRFDSHPCQLHLSPLATFDDDDDSDSISSNSSFRSCIDSINELSNIDTTEMSSLFEGSFQEISSSYNLRQELLDSTIKPSRSSVRHFCIVQ